jgi:DNA-binding NarL/FixJ family response regulator
VLAFWSDDPQTRRVATDGYLHAFSKTGAMVHAADGRALAPHFPELLIRGRWTELRESAAAYQNDLVLRVHALPALGEIDRAQGKRERVWRRVAEGLPAGPDSDPGSLYFVWTLQLRRLAAELAMDEQDWSRARQWIESYDRALDWSGRTLALASSRLLWARWHAGQNDMPAAINEAREALSLASEPRQPLALLAAHRMIGEFLTTRGDLRTAADHLAEALALAEACAAPYEQALTLLARADLMTAENQTSLATASLAAGNELLDTLDARPARDRARDIEARIQQGGGKQPRHAGLTPREIEVLRHVARGLTDSDAAELLFISPRTVARHLHSIYTKLDVNSRTAAASFAYQRGIL